MISSNNRLRCWNMPSNRWRHSKQEVLIHHLTCGWSFPMATRFWVTWMKQAVLHPIAVGMPYKASSKRPMN
ncbi:hypothetical protein THS27_13595 [Thalassospira sp. MCCC 1A01428]|nr:hypothetical protein THS27_13595 [Thalassospira sp. MCCC 1A01428]